MQSYILQLLLFVFITGWFVTPSHEPETKKKKKKRFWFFTLAKEYPLPHSSSVSNSAKGLQKLFSRLSS